MRTRLAVIMIGVVACFAVAAEPSSAEPAATISDGTWQVGGSVQPGIYMVTAPLQGPCRVALQTREGPRGDWAADSGRPEVSLRPGDVFTTWGCGTWVRLP